MRVEESLLLGRYKIVQDTETYRFTSDAVLLSRFLTAKKGERAADFCAGCGIVGLHFFALNEKTEHVTLIEMQPSLAGLCRETVALNGLGDKFTVEEMRVQDAPLAHTEEFSLILCNPPYENGGFHAADEGKAKCRAELTLTLSELIESARRCLKFGGRFAVIHRADRVSELLCTLSANGLEPKKLQFIAGKEGRKPYAVLVAAVKGGRAGVEVLPTLVGDGRTT